MSEEQKNEDQKDLRAKLKENEELANGLEISIPKTSEELFGELETTPEQKQKIMEDTKDELYTKNKYDYSLENALDQNEERKHRLELLIQSLPEDVNDMHVLKLVKWLCRYKDSFDDLKRDIQYYIEYGNLSKVRQEWFEDWYTQVDHLFLYEWKAAVKDIEHTWAKELWKQIKIYWCTDETFTHIFDWADSYGIDIPDYTTGENISYMWDYHNLEKAYEIDFVVTWLLSLPRSHQQRTQLEWLKKAFPDPLLREILVVTEEEVLHQWWASTESVWAMTKFATLWVLFRDKIDLSVMTDFHVRQCARLIRDGKDTESTIQNLLNYLWPIERDYENFDNLVETLQRMQEVFEEKKKQRTWIMRTSEEQKEVDKVDTKIDQIEFFFNNLKDEILDWRDFAVSVARSLPKDPDSGRIIKEDWRWDMFEWFERLRAKEVWERFKSYFPNYTIKKGNTLDEEVREYFVNHNIDPSKAETQIDLDASNFEEEYLKEAILEFSKFWLWENVEFPIDGYPENVSSELILNVIFYELKNRYEETWYLDWVNWVSDIKYDLFLHMLELGDTTFVESKMWEEKRGERLYCNYKNDRKKYGSRLNAIWKTSMKEWYDDVVNNMLEWKMQWGELLRYYWQRNTDWLKEDFTAEKLELLKNNFIVKDATINNTEAKILIHISDRNKIFKLNPPKQLLIWSERKKILTEQEKNIQETLWSNIYIQFDDIDWQTMWHYLADDTTLSEELWDKYLKRLWGYNSKKCVTETVYRDLDKRKKDEILHTPIQRWLLSGNTLWANKMNDVLLTRSQRLDMYEMVRSYSYEDWHLSVDNIICKDSTWRSLIHMISESSSNEEEVAMKLWLLYQHPTLGYKWVSDRSIIERKQETKTLIKEMLVHVNPLTKLSGLQTLAEYGHFYTVIQFIEKYDIDIRNWEEPEKIMHLIAQSEIASVEVYEWFYEEYKKTQQNDGYFYIWAESGWLNGKPLRKWTYIDYWLPDKSEDERKFLLYDIEKKQYHTLEWKRTTSKHSGDSWYQRHWHPATSFYCPIHPNQEEIDRIRKLQDNADILDLSLHADKTEPFPLLHQNWEHLLALVKSRNPKKLDSVLSQWDYIPGKETPNELHEVIFIAQQAKTDEEKKNAWELIVVIMKHYQKKTMITSKTLRSMINSYRDKPYLIALTIDHLAMSSELKDLYYNKRYEADSNKRREITQCIKDAEPFVENKDRFRKLFWRMY